MVTSNSLAYKIAKQRELAISELPKARLCADVVLSLASGDADVELAISKLKTGLGNNWSHVTAIQFMSGRQAKFSAECSQPDEQAPMLLAHKISEIFCNDVALRNLSFSELRQIASIFPHPPLNKEPK